jgi:hypothetical protein
MRDLASASIVLLKNEGSILPLDASSMQTIAVIGPNAKARLVSGGGSASLKASYFVTPYDGIVNAITEGRSNATVKYHEGCQGSGYLVQISILSDAYYQPRSLFLPSRTTLSPKTGSLVLQALGTAIRTTT